MSAESTESNGNNEEDLKLPGKYKYRKSTVKVKPRGLKDIWKDTCAKRIAALENGLGENEPENASVGADAGAVTAGVSPNHRKRALEEEEKPNAGETPSPAKRRKFEDNKTDAVAATTAIPVVPESDAPPTPSAHSATIVTTENHPPSVPPLPKNPPKPRKPVASSGPAGLNRKNRKKVKQHVQTEEPYAMKIQNVVSRTSGVPVDVGEMRHNWSLASYTPQKFPTASAAISFPQAVISQYATGEYGSAGSTHENSALIASFLWAYQIAKHQENEVIACRAQKAVNFTTSAAIGVPLPVIKLYEHLKNHPDLVVQFTPETIQSVRIKPNEAKYYKPSLALNAWRTGRFCVVGFKSPEEAAYGQPLEEWLRDFAILHQNDV